MDVDSDGEAVCRTLQSELPLLAACRRGLDHRSYCHRSPGRAGPGPAGPARARPGWAGLGRAGLGRAGLPVQRLGQARTGLDGPKRPVGRFDADVAEFNPHAGVRVPPYDRRRGLSPRASCWISWLLWYRRRAPLTYRNYRG